jgi:Rac GTPase-activating protein 1
LILNAEENRVLWLSAKRELVSMRDRMKKLEKENNDLKANLQRVRFSFGKEVQNREDLIKQRNALKNQLNAIKECVLEDPIAQQSIETRDKVLAFCDLNRLETVNEVSDDSLSGVEYDKSEEVLLDQEKRRSDRLPVSKSPTVSTNANECHQNVKRMSSGLQTIQNTVPVAEEVFEDNIEMDSEVNKRNRSFSEPVPQKSSTNVRNTIKSDSEAMSQILTRPPFLPFSMSSPLMKTNFVQKVVSQPISPIHGRSLLEDRKHNLHQKKAFKPLYCGPCRKAIGFCGTCYVCVDCQVISHTNCKDRLPLPCIPFRKPDGKSSQMLLIADFAPQTRPMIPALIIHCCNEIEKRGLEEEGLYRKSGSDREVNDLKDKILKSKSGMPDLAQYEVHVLCGVVKKFLRHLDEAIATRILWRDFLRAAGLSLKPTVSYFYFFH